LINENIELKNSLARFELLFKDIKMNFDNKAQENDGQRPKIRELDV